MSNIKKILMILSTILLVGIMYINSPYKAEKDLVVCSAHTIRQTSITDYITLQGKVIENCRRELYPKFPSNIKKVHVSQGDFVSRGDVLITLHTDLNAGSIDVFSNEIQKRLYNTQLDGFHPKTTFSAMAEPVEYAIISPIDGTVMNVYNREGEYVSGVFPCIAVSDLSDLSVEAEVSEENSALLFSGMACEISIPSAGDAPVSGQISTVAPYASAASVLEQSDTVRVSVNAQILEPQPELRPGYSASLKVQIGPTEKCFILPYRCLAQDDEGEYVLWPNSENILVRLPVETGRELQQGVEVLHGVEENMNVIECPEEYTAGERVKIQ